MTFKEQVQHGGSVRVRGENDELDTDPVVTWLTKQAEKNKTNLKVSGGRPWKWGLVLEGGQEAALYSVGR